MRTERRAEIEREDRAEIEAYERTQQPVVPLRDHLIGLSNGGLCVFCDEHQERIQSHPDMRCVLRVSRRLVSDGLCRRCGSEDGLHFEWCSVPAENAARQAMTLEKQ